MSRIFLSYASADKDRVRPIAHALTALGHQIWWDVEIAPGERFERVIAGALEKSSAVLVVWSAASIASEWVYEEADYGKRKNILVPVFIDECIPPMGFRMREGARLLDWPNGAELEWSGLVKSLQSLVGAPSKESSKHHATPSEPPAKASQAGQTHYSALDLRYDVAITLEEALAGKEIEVTVPSTPSKPSQTLAVKVPQGIEDGQRIRLAGQGDRSVSTGSVGDLYIFMSVAEHPVFERDGQTLFARAPVPMTVAALGGELDCPLLGGGVARLHVPKGSQTGKRLRVKGHGMPPVNGGAKGDLVVELFVETPVNLTSDQTDLLRKFAKSAGLKS